MSPRKNALKLASLYFATASLYILVSTFAASRIASSLREMWWIENLKGVFFILLSSTLLYFFSLRMFARLEARIRAEAETREALLNAERKASIGLLAASISHDCNNICTILRLSTERLRTIDGMPAMSADSLRRLDTGITQLTELTQRMRNAGREVLKDQSNSYDLETAIREALEFVSLHREVRGCDVRYVSNVSASANGNPSLIHQLIMNLVLNAAQATKGAGRIDVIARTVGEGLELEVHDNGPGVAEENAGVMVKSFQSTKSEGTGLGLMSVRTCAELFGGNVTVGQSQLGGACFKVTLPRLTRFQNFETPTGEVPLVRNSL